MTEKWQRNWGIFVDDMSARVSEGGDADALTQEYDGKMVHWQGVLCEKYLDHTVPTVELALNERHVDFGQGRIATLSHIRLPIARNDVDTWRSVSNGAAIQFSAVLGSGMSITRPIDVKLMSGTTILIIRLSEGRLTNS